MTSIRNLSTFPVSSGQQIPVFSTDDGVDGKISVSTLLAFFESAFASPEFTVQTAAPTGIGQTITITPLTSNVWLQVSPTVTIGSAIIGLPAAASAIDGQQILVTTSLLVGGITYTSAGATVTGAPTTVGVGGSFLLRYDTAALTWFCVGQSNNSSSTFTVATLPAVGSNSTRRAFVSDANTTMTLGIGAAVVGGGANIVPVYSDGITWRIG